MLKRVQHDGVVQYDGVEQHSLPEFISGSGFLSRDTETSSA